jgi:hypothetical protein
MQLQNAPAPDAAQLTPWRLSDVAEQRRQFSFFEIRPYHHRGERLLSKIGHSRPLLRQVEIDPSQTV